MKVSVLAVILVPALLFADQIFTFDRYLPDGSTSSGDIQYTDDAMGAALKLEDRSHVTIHDIVLRDSFTVAFWLRYPLIHSRVIIETDNASFWFDNDGWMRFRSGGKSQRKHLGQELVPWGKYSNDTHKKKYPWYSVVWTKRTYQGSFGSTHQVDSVWVWGGLLLFTLHSTGSDTWNRDTTNVTIGRVDADQTSKTLFFDHLCIFNEVASSDQLSDIESLYEPDGTVHTTVTPMVRKTMVRPKIGVYTVMGRRLDSQKPSAHWLIKTDQFMK